MKNCSEIFTNQSTEVETVFTLKEAHVYDIFHHFDKFSTTLQLQVITTTNDVYQGTTISTSFGVSCIPAEIHGEIGYSWVYGFNIYDEMNNVYNRIMEW